MKLYFKQLRRFLMADGADGGGGAPAVSSASGDNGSSTPQGGSQGGDPPPSQGGASPLSSVFDSSSGGAGAGSGTAEVPESYAFNIGEGLTMNDDLKNRFTEIAHGAKLTQEQANSLIKMHSDIMLDIIHENDNKINGWVKECQDKGYLSEANIGYAKAAINTFGGSEAMNVLMETGAINHPAVFKMVMTIGELISEDVPPGGGTPNAPKASADILFPNSKY